MTSKQDTDDKSAALLKTPLYGLHVEQSARLVDFAGYALPVQYKSILEEHKATREGAGLFDVSHMGQVILRGPDADLALETLVPGDIVGLASGAMRYTQFTNAAGGILDDLIVTRFDDHLFLVVNGACKQADLAHLMAQLPDQVSVEMLPDRALLALQGPNAAAIMQTLTGPLDKMAFMTARHVEILGVDCILSRCGYTGEDGFEISLPGAAAEALARHLLQTGEVRLIGLGARDSLRLEAGLCLYGHDLTTETTPIEAGLLWSISKRRRAEGGFLGADILQRQIAEGAKRKRVGLLPQGRAPVREGAQVLDGAGAVIGEVTSGGFGPTLGGPLAMAYVAAGHAKLGQELFLSLRGKAIAATVSKMPFVPQRYHRVAS